METEDNQKRDGWNGIEKKICGEIGERRKRKQEKKVQKRKQGDPEYVIRGDMMAVGVVSCLD